MFHDSKEDNSILKDLAIENASELFENCKTIIDFLQPRKSGITIFSRSVTLENFLTNITTLDQKTNHILTLFQIDDTEKTKKQFYTYVFQNLYERNDNLHLEAPTKLDSAATITALNQILAELQSASEINDLMADFYEKTETKPDPDIENYMQDYLKKLSNALKSTFPAAIKPALPKEPDEFKKTPLHQAVVINFINKLNITYHKQQKYLPEQTPELISLETPTTVPFLNNLSELIWKYNNERYQHTNTKPYHNQQIFFLQHLSKINAEIEALQKIKNLNQETKEFLTMLRKNINKSEKEIQTYFKSQTPKASKQKTPNSSPARKPSKS